MKASEKLKLLKVTKMILLICYISVLLFYLGLVLPEYLACVNCNYERAMGVDIWDNEIQCFGESKEFGKFFFQCSSMMLVGFTFVLVICYCLIYHLEKLLK
jgi:hypothetical protein